MILQVHSNTSYLSATKTRNRAGEYHYLIDNSEDPPYNGPIHNLCKILTNVMALTEEAEIWHHL